ncbi:phosphoribosyl transferase domain protein [Apiospora arundinis]
MALQYREGTEADTDAVSDAYSDSFSGDAITQRLFPATSPQSLVCIKDWLGGGLKDPHSRYILAVNPALSGKESVVALAKWVAPSAAAEPESPEAEDWASRIDWPEGSDVALGTEFFTMLEKKHEEHMGGRPHWYLELLAVRKGYQGKGVGKHLLKWGLELADKDGLEVYLQAGPAGVPLYRKCGFEDIEVYTVSSIGFTETFMRRKARPSQVTLP